MHHRARFLCLSVFVALLAAFFFSACGHREGRAAQGTREGVLHMGNETEPQELDPHLVTGTPEARLLSALFEGLVTLDEKTLDLRPAVAESWTISDDGLVFTFTLRANAKWSNGDPITADDFVYSWQRILEPKLAAQYAYMLFCIRNAKAYNDRSLADFSQVGVRAIDARTLEVTLENPTPYFLAMQRHSAWYPVHRKTIESFGAIDARNTGWTRAGNLVGNGPFRLTEWSPGKQIVTEKNEHYWDAGTVKLRAIHFYPLDNQQTEERMFRAGDLHVTGGMPINKIAVYQTEKNPALCVQPYAGTYYYRFNTTKPPFNDVRVRRAFALALNREEITKNVTKGGEAPAAALTPPGLAGYTCSHAMPYAPDEARKLLADAGYPGGQGLAPVELLYNTSEGHKLIAEAIAEMWKRELGVTVALLNQDWKVYLSSVDNLDYQVARSSWIADIMDPVNFLECFITNGGNNRTGWSSPQYDALLQRAAQSPDPAQRFALLDQAEGILLDEAPILPIYTYTRKFLKSPDVKGWESNILDLIAFKHVWLEPAAP